MSAPPGVKLNDSKMVFQIEFVKKLVLWKSHLLLDYKTVQNHPSLLYTCINWAFTNIVFVWRNS